MIRILLLALFLTGCQHVVTTILPHTQLGEEYQLIRSYGSHIIKCKQHLESIGTLENSSCMKLWNYRYKLYEAATVIEDENRILVYLNSEDLAAYKEGKQLSADLREIVDLAKDIVKKQNAGDDDFGEDIEYIPLD